MKAGEENEEEKAWRNDVAKMAMCRNENDNRRKLLQSMAIGSVWRLIEAISVCLMSQ